MKVIKAGSVTKEWLSVKIYWRHESVVILLSEHQKVYGFLQAEDTSYMEPALSETVERFSARAPCREYFVSEPEYNLLLEALQNDEYVEGPKVYHFLTRLRK